MWAVPCTPQSMRMDPPLQRMDTRLRQRECPAVRDGLPAIVKPRIFMGPSSRCVTFIQSRSRGCISQALARKRSSTCSYIAAPNPEPWLDGSMALLPIVPSDFSSSTRNIVNPTIRVSFSLSTMENYLGSVHKARVPSRLYPFPTGCTSPHASPCLLYTSDAADE